MLGNEKKRKEIRKRRILNTNKKPSFYLKKGGKKRKDQRNCFRKPRPIYELVRQLQIIVALEKSDGQRAYKIQTYEG